jgi:hypothetical protein
VGALRRTILVEMLEEALIDGLHWLNSFDEPRSS